MGQLFLVDDCVTQQELLNEIAQRFNKSVLNERKKVYSHKMELLKKSKSVQISKKKSETCIRCDIPGLPSLKQDSNTLRASSSSRASCICATSSHSQLPNGTGFQPMNGQLKKKPDSTLERPCCSGQSDKNKGGIDLSGKVGRKRKRVNDAKEQNLTPVKFKKPCEILKEKLKKSLANGSKGEPVPVSPVNAEHVDMKDKPKRPCEDNSVCAGSANGSIAFCGRLPIVSNEQDVNNEAIYLEAVQDVDMPSIYDNEENVIEKKCDKMGHLTRESGHCSRNGHSHRVEISRSLTVNSESSLEDRNITLSLQRIFEDASTSSATPADGDNLESEHDQCCADKNKRGPTTRDIPNWMYVAVDCEMVGIGPKGRESVLARCSIVDYDGNVVYDKYIRPSEIITDYRTRWSGIRPVHMKTAVPIQQALRDIRECLAHKIVVGHAVYHDFKVLGLKPDHYFVRDTAQCKQLVDMANLQGRGNSLKKLSEALLERKIQTGNNGHCSVEDARATLDLFKLIRHTWEPELYAKWSKKDRGVHKKIASFVDTGIKLREMDAADDFLNDKFWPNHVMD